MSTSRLRTKTLQLILVVGSLLAWAGLSAAGAGRWAEPQAGSPATPPPAAAPKPAAPVKNVRGNGPGSWFLHEHHSGQVAVPGKKGETRELKCETCHAVSDAANDTNRFPGPDLVKNPDLASRAGMGTKLGGLGFVKAHSSCTECHSQIAPGSTWNCKNCHVSTAQLREFPNPAIQLSQFADKFAHKDHSASKCSDCHDNGPKDVSQILPEHKACFVCHSFKSDGQEPLANNCTGCHANLGPNTPTVDPKLKPPKVIANAVAASLLAPRFFVTPTAPNPPFNHVGGTTKYHEIVTPDAGPSAGKTLRAKAACTFCHTSAARATTREQMLMFAAKKDAPAANQPPGAACASCHVHAVQMWANDGKPPTKAQQAQCKACHSAADAAKAPPASHMPLATAAPATTTTPAATTPEPAPKTEPPATKTEPKKTEAPPTKSEPKKTEAPATKTAPAPKTEPAAKKTEPPATKTEPAKTAPVAKTEPPATKTAPTPTATAPPAKIETPAAKVEPPAAKTEPPAAAAGPVAAHGKYDKWATKNPDGSAPSKNQPTGTILLGRKDDPIAGAIWGQEKPTASFNHANHIKPNYAASCEVCHHTNTDTKVEGVLRCVACHKESGNEKNPLTEDGNEVDVQNAYHGVPGGKLEAGCIECHKKKGAGPTACAACHDGKAGSGTVSDDLRVVACHAPFGASDAGSDIARLNVVARAVASVVQPSSLLDMSASPFGSSNRRRL